MGVREGVYVRGGVRVRVYVFVCLCLYIYIRIVEIKRADKRRLDELRVEVGVKNSFKK